MRANWSDAQQGDWLSMITIDVPPNALVTANTFSHSFKKLRGEVGHTFSDTTDVECTITTTPGTPS